MAREASKAVKADRKRLSSIVGSVAGVSLMWLKLSLDSLTTHCDAMVFERPDSLHHEID